MAAMLLDKLRFCLQSAFYLAANCLFCYFLKNICTVKFVPSHNSWSFRNDFKFFWFIYWF